MDKKTFRAISALVGTIIGAGIFGIPYAFLKGGALLSTIYLITLMFVNLILNLAFGEIILRTKGDHQLAGYARIYLGKGAKTFVSIAQILGLFGAMLAYIILAGDFIGILSGYPEASSYFSIGFALLGAAFLLFSLKSISKIEGFLFYLLIFLPIVIIAASYPQIKLSNLSIPPTDVFLPYGVFLFSLSGLSIIPEIEEILRTRHKSFYKSILIGTIIPAVVYLIFGLGAVGIAGNTTSEDALYGLSNFIGSNWIRLGSVLGIIAVITSYLTIGFVLRELFFRDFKLRKNLSWLIVAVTPIISYLSGFRSFIGVIGFTGSILLGSLGIIIMLIYEKAKYNSKRTPYFKLNLPIVGIVTIVLILALGIIFELNNFFQIL